MPFLVAGSLQDGVYSDGRPDLQEAPGGDGGSSRTLRH